MASIKALISAMTTKPYSAPTVKLSKSQTITIHQNLRFLKSKTSVVDNDQQASYALFKEADPLFTPDLELRDDQK